MSNDILEKTYDPGSFENALYEIWCARGAFTPVGDEDKPSYTIMMPPPNVTGSLHIGHALTMTLQDVLTRYHRRLGHDTLWQPGTDHAGIATQMVVERQLAEKGLHRQDLGREEFIQRIWQWRDESGDQIHKQLRRLGMSPDWSRNRFTMDEGLSKAVRRVFTTLYRQGLIYRDKRLVNWDPKLHTAISDLEVESREQEGDLWYMRYPLTEGSGYVVVATTRPETLFGDAAVAVHPEDERYRHLIGQHVKLPLTNREIPIIADAFVDLETGTGAVKITPAHDFDDFEVGRRHNLPMINIFDHNAVFNEEVPEPYQNLERYEARKRVIVQLDSLGLIDKIEPHKNMLPYGDRSGVVIEPRLTDQWYVDAERLAAPAIKAVREKKTVIFPQQWEKTYFDWLENIQPWCISRQLWWGHQIPAWYGPDQHIFVAETAEEAQEQADTHYGHPVELTQDPDVLDTWFSSALWPFSTLGWPDTTPELSRYYPGNVLVTGFDIIFFWVARMMMMGLHFMDEVPFHHVYVHALVRDEKGQKMSKSKGNVIDPLVVSDEYGADSLRFTLTALAVQGRDIKLSEKRVAGYRNFTTKLWNAVRFCDLKQARPDPEFLPESCQHFANQWIISEVISLEKKMRKSLQDYRFHELAQDIYQFVWHDFCDWYVELAKILLEAEDSQLEKETRGCLSWALLQILHLLNPLMPFLTEKLWHYFHGADAKKDPLLMSAPWPNYDHLEIQQSAGEEMARLIRYVTLLRTARTELNVPHRAEFMVSIKDFSQPHQNFLQKNQHIFRRLTRVKAFTPVSEFEEGLVQAVDSEGVFGLHLAGLVDFAAEKQRLNKALQSLEADMHKLSKKLENKQFLAKAPPEVVEENQKRYETSLEQRDKLQQALRYFSHSS